MIREFIKVNDSDYVLSDDSGNMRVIKLGDDLPVEEFVTVENELEYYTNCLKKCDDKIKLINFNKFLKKFLQIPTSLILAAVIFFLSDAVQSMVVYEQIACLVGSNIVYNTLINLLVGSFRKNNKKLKNYIKQNNELREKVDTLKEILKEIKEKTSYVEYEEELEQSTTNDLVVGKRVDLVESYNGRNVFSAPEYTFKKKVRVLKKD